MTRVLIANAYFYKLDAKQWKFKQPYPPLATLWAAAVIRNLGLNVSFFDTSLKNTPEEIIPVLDNANPKYLIIYDDGFNYLTKMCLTVMREAACLMIRAAKEKGCTVIISSSDAADHYQKYLLHGADYVIRGEGEETLKELLSALEEEKDVSNIQGLAFTKKNSSVVTPSRQVIKDLDALPLPSWDLVDIHAYRKIWMQYHKYFSLNLATTRGCPFKCNWCAKPIYGTRYNSRSPRHVADEIEFLLQNYAPDHFWMSDDIFGLKPGWVQTFRDEMRKRNMSFRYKIQSRVDLLLQEDTIEALSQSGAETVWVGAESGAQKILDAMDKGTTVDQIEKATLLLRQHGIKVAFFLQFGYPGETWADIEATLKMVLRLVPDEIGISVSYPLPGTKFYENVKAGLKEKQNWSDSNDLAMMFQGTFSPTFYKILHRYIHSRYRVQRGLSQIGRAWRRSSLSGLQLRGFASMIYHIPVSFLQSYQLRRLRSVA